MQYSSICWAKMSLSQSIVRALGRLYQRVSSGSVPDEAKLRGHTST